MIPEPPDLKDRADLVESLVPLAARLVCAVHDDGPDTVRQVLAEVPAARWDALAVVLAAMVDPDRTTLELLAWTDEPLAVRSRDDGLWRRKVIGAEREHGSERGYQQHRYREEMPACTPCRLAHNASTREARVPVDALRAVS